MLLSIEENTHDFEKPILRGKIGVSTIYLRTFVQKLSK
jgi:hypothetical protein